MLIIFAILTCLMIAVILNDTTRYLIPNWLVLALMALYPVMVHFAPTPKPDWGMACIVATATFVVGLVVLFHFMGGGDVKLLTAVSLYMGTDVYPQYIMLVAIGGGIIAILLLAFRPLVKLAYVKRGAEDKIPRVLRPGEKYMPYGAAIAIAFLILLWQQKLPGLVM